MTRRPLLFTPGPLTTSDAVRAAMGRDWGSRSAEFIELTARVQRRLLALLDAPEDQVCVLVQGSGSFAVEAMLDTFLRPEHRVLVLANGAYGQRIAAMLARFGQPHEVLASPEEHPTPVQEVAERLAAAREQGAPFSHVVLVHCETTSGVRNPLEAVADLCAQAGATLLVDAMSSLGCLPIPLDHPAIGAVAASANKCLQGVPGLAFVIARQAALQEAAGNARSLVLDLQAQWRGFQANGQWRFTPPVQVLAAFDVALAELEAEGGIAARRVRYAANCKRIVEGMAAFGLSPLVDPADQAPVILTFGIPPEVEARFDAIQEGLSVWNIAIYPGKLTATPSLRIGCIGDLHAPDIDRLLEALGDVLRDLQLIGPGSGGPTAAG